MEEKKVWIKSFDTEKMEYSPKYDYPLRKDERTFESLEACKIYCDQCNREADAAWDNFVKVKLRRTPSEAFSTSLMLPEQAKEMKQRFYKGLDEKEEHTASNLNDNYTALDRLQQWLDRQNTEEEMKAARQMLYQLAAHLDGKLDEIDRNKKQTRRPNKG